MRTTWRLPLIVAVLCGCSPALDWREVRPPEWGVEAMFPCRPASVARDVVLPSGRAAMRIYACAADGMTFALGSLALHDVRDAASTLGFLHEAAARNLGASQVSAQPFEVPGMTPNARAGHAMLAGRRPDGSAVTEHLLLFARGARLYQASVVGSAPSDGAVSAFFAGLKFVP
jgi:hypothetical protein